MNHRTATTGLVSSIPVVAVLAALAVIVFPLPAAGTPLAPGNLVALDALADPLLLGGFGAAFAIDRAAAPETNSRTIGSSLAFVQLESIAAEPSGRVLVTDAEADPAALGSDENGGLGAGAVFAINPDTVTVTVLSDGTLYRPGLTPPKRTIFVDPIGLAVDATGRIIVVDPDSDPSGFGLDPAGSAGYGGVFSVDSANGEVDLIADGSNYPAGLPLGEPSVFVDPVAVAAAADGSLLILDIGADPLATGAKGVVFRVAPASDVITLVSADASLAVPFDLAVEPGGTVLVSDLLADPLSRGDRGALFRIDPSIADPLANTSVLVASSLTRSLGGVEATGSGHVFLVDALADGMGLGRTGTIWEVDPATGALAAISSTASYFSLIDVAAARFTAAAPTLTSLAPVSAAQAELLTVVLTGTGFSSPATARFGAGIDVLSTRVDSPSRISVDLHVTLTAVPGPRDVVAGNADLQGAVLARSFEVLAKSGPQLLAITPDAAAQGDTINVVLTGQYFDSGATLAMGAGITVTTLTFISPGELRAQIDIAGSAPPGPRDVVVTNGDLRSATLAGAFQVTPPRAPTVISVTPPTAPPGPLSLTLVGTDFRPGAAVDLGAGVRVTRVEWISQTTLAVSAAAPFSAAPGSRDVRVTNPDLQSGVLPAGFALIGRTRLERVALRLDDVAGGNDDGRIDPGETVDLVLTLANRGNATASAIAARLALAAPRSGVSVASGFVTFPDAAPGAVVTRPAAPHLAIRLTAAVPCGTWLPLELRLADGSGVERVFDFTLVVGHPDGVGRKPEFSGSAGDAAGRAVASAGDLDGDGAGDFLIGSPFDDPGGRGDAGLVQVVSGFTGALLRRFEGAAPGDQAGTALAGGGRDFDGDQVPDWAVGAPGAGAGGVAQVVSGASGASLLMTSGSAPGDGCGEAVALADFDGDGTLDLAVGSPGASRVDIWSGRSGALSATLTGPAVSDFGRALAASDIDGDGFDDLIVGAPLTAAGAGRIEVHSLAAGLLAARDGVGAEALGSSVAAAADLEGDGRGDVVGGAPGFDPGGLAGAGRVMILSGASGGLLRVASGVAAGEQLGSSVAGGVDADLDGVPDYAASAPGSGGGPTAPGRIEIRSGASGLGILAVDGTLYDEHAGSGGLAFVDRDGDGTPDLLIGSPEAAPGLQLGAGAAYVLTRGLGCTSWTPCADDTFEDNDTWAAAKIVMAGTTAPLVACPADEDWFRFDVPAGGERVFSITFNASAADLDLYAWNALGDLVAVSASNASPEAVRVVASTAETFRVRVLPVGGAGTSYSADLLDGASCDVVSETTALTAVKAAGGKVQLAWAPSSDPCHESSPSRIGYRVYAATTSRPAAVANFPVDPPFTEVTTPDADGSSSDPSWTGVAPGSTLSVFVVLDIGTSGNPGPAGHY